MTKPKFKGRGIELTSCWKELESPVEKSHGSRDERNLWLLLQSIRLFFLKSKDTCR